MTNQELLRRLRVATLFPEMRPWEMVRYEARTARGRIVLLEIRGGSPVMPDPDSEIDIDRDSELWRVNYEVFSRYGSPGKPELREVGSWPLVPATRAEARYA